MCGISHTSDCEKRLIVAHQESSSMPPSVTVGEAEPAKTVTPDIQSNIPTIDLSADESDDLQKALALSLQEQNAPDISTIAGISAEERDVSKALEVSLQDSANGATIDILNPQDRKRILGFAVGLKNIGNSCWFNVVIQSLFFIPAFRNMIINYPVDIEEECNSKISDRNIVPVLRQIFGLLIGSDRKYVDPSDAVRLFQNHEMQKNTQQDVCEFIHKLLEKLEENFKTMLKKREKEGPSSSMNKESDFENPIIKLFYGQCKSDENKHVEAKAETFGQYILSVMSCKDIHESILASMMKTPDSDTIQPSYQNRWFKVLPSVLIFSLSRYEYSKEKKRAEKVHNKFDFPEILYMDRYMECNKETVKKKHIKIAKLKRKLKELYETLEKYLRFGSGESKCSIGDILKYTLEFVNGGKDDFGSHMDVDVVSDSLCNDVEMQECQSIVIEENSTNKVIAENITNDYAESLKLLGKFKQISPAPECITSAEFSVLNDCLSRWQEEVEAKVCLLKHSIADLESQLLSIYNEATLQRMPYKLHAVVVHEGQASGGHYWVYIHDSFKNEWVKFNDIQISDSNWAELRHDSIGGQINASAYCLMYVDHTQYDTLFLKYKSSLDNWPAHLPIDLQEYIKEENTKFLNELLEWEAQQEQLVDEQDIKEVSATAPNSPDLIITDDEDMRFFIDIETLLYQNLKKICHDQDTCFNLKGLKGDNWLMYIIQQEVSKIAEAATIERTFSASTETSLLDFIIYLKKNKAENILLIWYGFELTWHICQQGNSQLTEMIQDEAIKKLRLLHLKYSSLGSQYMMWKRLYLSYIYSAWYFVNGFKKFKARHFESALYSCTQALKYYRQALEASVNGNAKTLDYSVIGLSHRRCLLIVNKRLLLEFENADNEGKLSEISQSFQRLVYPSLCFLNNSGNLDDTNAGDSLRNSWFQKLADTIVDENKMSLLQQILNLMTSDQQRNPMRMCTKIGNVPKAATLMREYKTCATELFNLCNQNNSQVSDL